MLEKDVKRNVVWLKVREVSKFMQGGEQVMAKGETQLQMPPQQAAMRDSYRGCLHIL